MQYWFPLVKLTISGPREASRGVLLQLLMLVPPPLLVPWRHLQHLPALLLM